MLKVPPLRNDLAAYQFDGCVAYVVLVIKNALQERQTVGNESVPRYSLERLLDPEFRLPRAGASDGGYKAMAAAHPGAVGRWKQVAKEG